MAAAFSHPQPSMRRAALTTLSASICGALGGSLGLILWTILLRAPPSGGVAVGLSSGLIMWLFTAPIAILVGGLPAFVGVVLVGWPIALLLNSRGWFGTVSMILAGALIGSFAGFAILSIADLATEFSGALLAGSLGGAGAGLGLSTGFGRRAVLDTTPSRD